MDAIGCFTYAVPVLGEFADVIWAPISGIIFYITFGGWKGTFGGLFNFAEELLPGTDFIPMVAGSFYHAAVCNAGRCNYLYQEYKKSISMDRKSLSNFCSFDHHA